LVMWSEEGSVRLGERRQERRLIQETTMPQDLGRRTQVERYEPKDLAETSSWR